MAGLLIPLDDTLANSDYPLLRQDEILSDGSLILVDASHGYGGFGAGLPADNTPFENIAWKEAAALMPGETQLSVRPWFDLYAGAGFTRERSGKGGLHFILSQAGDLGANIGAEIMMPTALRAYLAANPSHAYYLSTWTRLTRTAQDVVSGVTLRPATATIQNNVGSTSNSLAFMDKDDNAPSAGGKRLGSRMSNGANTLGNSFRAVAADGWTGTLPATASDIRQGLLIAGARGAYGALASSAGAPSFILYRYYLEDLTVGGRSYADVEALDLAAYTRAFATGGKFASDTFTAPV